ncbi:MAG: hypothetical protein ACR2KK_13880 [Acidimicrobiales bacterium]
MKAHIDAALSDQGASLRSDLEGALAARLDQVRSEAVAIVEGRIGAVEERQGHAAMPDEAMAARLDAIDRQVEDGLTRLSTSIEAVQAQPVPEPDLEELRSQVRTTVAEQLAGVREEVLVAAHARVAAAEDNLVNLLAADATAHDQARGRIDAVERDASVRLEALEAHVGPELRRLTEAVEELQARMSTSAAIADQLGAARTEAVAVADARVAGAEARLLGRLDGIADAMAHVTERSAVADTALARLDTLEREASERLTALEQQAPPELLRLAGAVEDLERRSATVAHLERLRADVERTVDEKLAQLQSDVAAGAQAATDMETRSRADLVALRAEMQAGLAEQLVALRSEASGQAEIQLAVVRTDLQQQLDRFVDMVAETSASARSADLALARMATAERHVNDELIRLSESFEANRAELTTLVQNLETGLARWAVDWRREVEHRLARAGHQFGPAPVGPNRRLGGNRKVLRAEVARLAEAVEAWRAQSVDEDDFVNLRSELETVLARRVAAAQAEVERRFAVLDAVAADAAAQAGAAAPIRSDVRGLQVEVRELTTVVSELQEIVAPPEREPAPRRTLTSVRTVPADRSRAVSKNPASKAGRPTKKAAPSAGKASASTQLSGPTKPLVTRPAKRARPTTEVAREPKRESQNSA